MRPVKTHDEPPKGVSEKEQCPICELGKILYKTYDINVERSYSYMILYI